VTPEVTVKNLSADPQSFEVDFAVDSNGTRIYSDTLLTPILDPGEVYQGTFAEFTPTSLDKGLSYVMTSWTSLPGDQYSENDTLMDFTTIALIESGRALSAPVLDGLLSDGEWDDAVRINVSDRLGTRDLPNGTDCCFLHLMNDGEALYMAFEVYCDTFPGNGDQVLLRFDENLDGAWASDSSEGSHFVVADVSGDYSQFVAHPSGYTVNNPETPTFGISLIPYRVYEVAMAFGEDRTELDAYPGDSVGLFCLALDRPAGYPDDVIGLWPPSLDVLEWDDPAAFGEIYLTFVCGDVNGDGLVNAEDVGALSKYLVGLGETPVPLRAGDANGNGIVTSADAAYLVNYLYYGGPAPVCP
jgi:hypothetical protein